MLLLFLKLHEVMEQSKDINRKSIKFLVIGFLLFMVTIVSAFFGGFYFHRVLNTQERIIIPTTSVPSTEEVFFDSPVVSNNYPKGKQFFEDTVVAVTNDNNKILIATVSRQEIESGVNQATRVSFFDGEKWIRKSTVKNYDTAQIYTNDIITQWKIDYDPSRVLKQQVSGLIQMDDDLIKFDTNIVTNNIGIRSLPDYTKFMSNGEGTLVINDEKFSTKILYTRIYSNNSQGIQFYDNPIGLTTNWLVFWDNEGNFYHIDSTFVDNPTDIYKTHKIGIIVDNGGRVSKTFDVEVSINSDNPPSLYNIQLGSPINQVLTFTTQNSVNKAPNNSYSWFMSKGVGQAGNTKGFGLVEYIHY